MQSASDAGDGPRPLDPRVFERLCAIAHERAGIHLKDGKQGLVAARIAKRMRALSIESPRRYLQHLEADDSGEELRRFLDAISTNYTFFFREPDHFEVLGAAVKRWVAEGHTRLRIWSAASSSGEEPYSIAFTVLEALGGRELDFQILATDISSRVLEHARAGIYTSDRIGSVPEGVRRRFLQTVRGRADAYQVRPEITERVHFRRLNLSAPPFPMKGPFDVVFCRNVLIYFDQAVRQRLITAIDGLLRPGGWLCIGHTETLTGIRHGLRLVRPSTFWKPSGELAGADAARR